jgi:hypothetical protein
VVLVAAEGAYGPRHFHRQLGAGQGTAGQVAQLHPALFEQGMAGVAEQGAGVAAQGNHVQQQVVGQFTDIGDEQLDGVVQQALVQAVLSCTRTRTPGWRLAKRPRARGTRRAAG